jgi:DNA-binding LytR/AlgR family response regulator
MRFTVGICDDNPEQVKLLRQYLNGFQIEDELTIIEATEPEDFLVRIEANKPQLLFLDIDMGELNGIKLGERIKESCEDAVIVYITAHEKYALEAFQVRAFHYLLKPLTIEKFHQVLAEALSFVKRNQGKKTAKTFTINTKGEMINLYYSEIYYFEKIGHRIKVHTKARDIFFYEKLYNLLTIIDADTFIQCHQGYVVNVDKIRGFRDKTLMLERDITLPVSRSFVEHIKEVLADKLFAGKDGL